MPVTNTTPSPANSNLLQPLQQDAAWRTQAAKHIQLWQQWLRNEELSSNPIASKLSAMSRQLNKTHYTVAVVAEVSRGKSELINAMLFTEHGRRIVPAGAGRTTMCPTEFFCDKEAAPYIELLPIETRADAATLSELRNKPGAWERFPLAADNPDSLARAMLKVGDTQAIAISEAQRLGLADDDEATASGVMDVPRWRHARVNLHHPLLASGLTILDTPGLNALGHEPELTYAILPNVDAVLFLVSAEVGVTKSDQDAWNSYLGHLPPETKLLVLNKIDTLWDELRTPLETQAEIAQQLEVCAKALAVPVSQVFAVSAQQALIARIQNKSAVVEKSRLPQLENALTTQLLSKRHRLLQTQTQYTVDSVHEELSHGLHANIERSQFQLGELDKLKNQTTAPDSVSQYALETRARYETESAQLLSLRKVINAHSSRIFEWLSTDAIEALFSNVLVGCNNESPANIKKLLQRTIEDVHTRFVQAKAESDAAVTAMRTSNFEMVNASAAKPTKPSRLNLDESIAELERLMKSATSSVPTLPILSRFQRSKTSQVVLALLTRCRQLSQLSNVLCEQWLYNLVGPVERALKERQAMLRKRTDTLERMSSAKESLIEHVETLNQSIAQDQLRLLQLEKQHNALHTTLFSPRSESAAATSAKDAQKEVSEIKVSDIDKAFVLTPIVNNAAA